MEESESKKKYKFGEKWRVENEIEKEKFNKKRS
jgi:hypothetical protein